MRKNKTLRFLFVLIANLLLFNNITIAMPVDSTTARKVATNFYNWKSGRSVDYNHAQLVYTQQIPSQGAVMQTSPATALYVFDFGGHFVMTSADTRVTPVLAYSTESGFDADGIAESIGWFLDEYVQEIEFITRTMSDSECEETASAWNRLVSGEMSTMATATNIVGPLISTTWNQSSPYNSFCPADPNGHGGHAYAGCVACAMAQLIRHWEYPSTGIGSHSYEANFASQGYGDYGTQSVNFSTANYNYSLMPLTLNGASQAQINEVAKLMYHCGVSVEMMYGPYGSGASDYAAVAALQNHFGFEGAELKTRGNDAASWIAMIKNELNNLRPVYYSGQGTGGHAFICDGYDGEGLFHFNWGWRGDLDGWYALAECNPYATGEGDGNGWDGFSIDQMAMINLFPDEEPSDVRLTVDALECKKDTLTRDGIGEDFLVPVDVTVFNQTAGQRTYDIGLALYADGDQRDTTWKVASGVAIQPNYGVMFSKLLAIGEGVGEGQFILRFVCRQAGTEPWLWGYNGDIYLMLNVKGDTLTVEKPVTRLAVKGIRFEGSRQPGTLATMQVKLSNEGRRMYDELYLFVNNRHTTGVGLFVDAGETREVPLHFQVPEDPVVLKLYTGIVKTGDNSYKPGGLLLWDGTVSDTSREPNLWVNNIVIDRRTYYQEKTAIVGTAFSQTATLTNNDSEPFDGDVLAYLYKNSDEGDWFNFERYQVQHVTIAPGAAADIPFSFTGLTVGLRYLTNLHVNSPTGMKLLVPSQTYAYRILGNIPHTAVEALEANPAGKPLYYDMQGRPIGQPRTKGLYITKGRKLLAK